MNHVPLPLNIADKADADIEEISFYFAQRAPDVADRFYLAFKRTIRQLAESPNLGERCRFRHPKTKGMRIWQVDGFSNYLIFYCLKEGMLQILRVIHGARDYETIFNEK